MPDTLILGRQFALQGLVLGQRLAQDVLDEVGLARHALGQLARAGDGLWPPHGRSRSLRRR